MPLLAAQRACSTRRSPYHAAHAPGRRRVCPARSVGVIVHAHARLFRRRASHWSRSCPLLKLRTHANLVMSPATPRHHARHAHVTSGFGIAGSLWPLVVVVLPVGFINQSAGRHCLYSAGVMPPLFNGLSPGGGED